MSRVDIEACVNWRDPSNTNVLRTLAEHFCLRSIAHAYNIAENALIGAAFRNSIRPSRTLVEPSVVVAKAAELGLRDHFINARGVPVKSAANYDASLSHRAKSPPRPKTAKPKDSKASTRKGESMAIRSASPMPSKEDVVPPVVVVAPERTPLTEEQILDAGMTVEHYKALKAWWPHICTIVELVPVGPTKSCRTPLSDVIIKLPNETRYHEIEECTPEQKSTAFIGYDISMTPSGQTTLYCGAVVKDDTKSWCEECSRMLKFYDYNSYRRNARHVA